MAEALAELLAQRYGTAKQLARGVGIDIKTAENLRSGHLSVTTLQKILRAEGRGLFDKLGDELFGETFYQHEERHLNAVLSEATHAKSNLVRLRNRSEELHASAADLDEGMAGPAPSPKRSDTNGTGPVHGRASTRQAVQTERPAPAVEPRSLAPKRGER